MDPVGNQPLEGVHLDAEALCHLLARLDAGSLPELPPVFGGGGPHIQPLFRGPNAELLVIRWLPGDKLPISTLADTAMAIRPLDGHVELLSFAQAEGAKEPQLVQIETIGPGQLAGIPAGAVHSVRAHAAATTLHLCAPPIMARQTFLADWH